jgi:AcrR family transcriptional regulator
MTAALGRRERKKAATRVALREAALRLAARHGVEHVTVEQIATEADIAVRTFFNYFASREEALVATLTAGAEALITEFRARPRSESVLAALREAALIVLRTGDWAQIDALRLIVRAPSLAPQRLAVFAAEEKALATAIAERVGATSRRLYPALCAATALTALRVLLDDWLDRDTFPPALLRKQVDQVIATLADGLDHPGAT